MFRRIESCQSAAQNSKGSSTGIEGTAVSSCVNASGQSTDDCDACLSQGVAEALGLIEAARVILSRPSGILELYVSDGMI